MKAGMTVLLASDRWSIFKRGQLYGKKDEEVMVISISDNMAIVELKGNRFPIRIEELKIKQ
jgi:hypothetical protein